MHNCYEKNLFDSDAHVHLALNGDNSDFGSEKKSKMSVPLKAVAGAGKHYPDKTEYRSCLKYSGWMYIP